MEMSGWIILCLNWSWVILSIKQKHLVTWEPYSMSINCWLLHQLIICVCEWTLIELSSDVNSCAIFLNWHIQLREIRTKNWKCVHFLLLHFKKILFIFILSIIPLVSIIIFPLVSMGIKFQRETHTVACNLSVSHPIRMKFSWTLFFFQGPFLPNFRKISESVPSFHVN